MRWFFTLVIFIAGMPCNLTAQEVLEWSEKKRLTVNDFKGTPEGVSQHQSIILSFGLEVKIQGEDVQSLQSYNGLVSNNFVPDKSWIDWRNPTYLRYANTLFDINEWMVREFRKRLLENRKLVVAGQYRQIQDEVAGEFVKIREQYDNDSNYGNYPEGQLRWETRIAERLYYLADFCKSCSPAK